MPTKTKKTVPVKSLRKAIQDGMSLKEAGEHALADLKPKLNMFSEEVDVALDMEELIEDLVKIDDRSLKFEVEEDWDNDSPCWILLIDNDDVRFEPIFYFPFNMDFAKSKASEDAKTLNRFVLDFYGIKKHETTKSMARTKTKQIRAEISNKQKEIKALQAELKKLAKIT